MAQKNYQQNVLPRVDEFEGSMIARRYISINRTTKLTATLNLQDLVDKNNFVRKGTGHSTAYELNFEM